LSQEVYPHQYNKVWSTTVNIVNDSKLELVCDNSQSGEIFVQNTISAFSYGENDAIFVNAVNKSNTNV